MTAYDVFISYRHTDAEAVAAFVEALRKEGLEVWFDEQRIDELASIQAAIEEGLGTAKVLVAWYSAAYPESRPCQWEFTTALLAALAQGQAMERILVINPEKGPDHILPNLFRDQKHLIPDTGDLTAPVRVIKERVGRVIGDFASLAQRCYLTSRPSWHGRYGTSADYFTGRLPDMWRIHSTLHADQYPVIHAKTLVSVVQVFGLGGMGKSLLAEEYALRFGSQYPGGVFWFNSRADIQAQVEMFAAELGVMFAGFKPDEVRAALGKKLADAAQTYLWIVDDLPDDADETIFKALLPPENRFAKTIITTRSRQFEGRGALIPLDELPLSDAVALLTRVRKPDGASEAEVAEEICRDLGFHPLALDVASRAMQTFPGLEPFAVYRQRLAAPTKDELEFAASLKGRLPNDHEKSIATTLLTSIDTLSEDGLTLLRLAAEIASTPIPMSLINGVFSHLASDDESTVEAQVRRGLDELVTSGLGRFDATASFLLVHSIVTRTIRFRKVTNENLEPVLRAAVDAFQPIFEKSEDVNQHTDIAPYAPHVHQILRHDLTDEKRSSLAEKVARYDYLRGYYRMARELQERVLAVSRRILGEEHPDTLTIMNNLAIILEGLGELACARKLSEQALDSIRRIQGKEHPKTLIFMENLALTLRNLGELASALELQERVLVVRSGILGEEHPDTLRSMTNLAETLSTRGDLAGARILQERVLAISRRILGKDHPDTLHAMNDLALTIWDIGELAGARELIKQCLAFSRRIQGEEHLKVLILMDNLAQTLGNLGDLADARELHERVLAVSRRILGEEHPGTLRTMNNLAETLRALGEFTGARELQERVLAVSLRILGEEHPKTLISMSNLAGTLLNLGNLTGARDLYARVLEVSLRILGEEHPDALIVMHNLAETLRDLGDLAKAKELHEQVLAVHRRILGEEHPKTLRTMNFLGLTLRDLGELNVARELHERVLAAQLRILGEEHPVTLSTMNYLGLTLRDLGELAGAREIQQQVLDARRRILGEKHHDTTVSAWNLFLVLMDSQEKDATEEVLKTHLEWLLQADPNLLSSTHIQIRQYFIDMLNQKSWLTPNGGTKPWPRN